MDRNELENIDRIKDIEENVKVGLLDIIILKFISEKDMYGYEIKQKLIEDSNNTITIGEGSLYGPLYRLEKKNLITSYKRIVGQKRFRIYYHIEPLGIEHLELAKSVCTNMFKAAIDILAK